MKQFLLFVFSSSLILGSGCKKDKETPPSDPTPEVSTVVDCTIDTFTFSRVLQGTDEYKDAIQDRGKRIVAITQNKIERYDIKGNLEWSKALVQAGTMQNLIQADNDNYFVTAANRQIDDYKPLEFYAPDFPQGRELRLTSYWKGWGSMQDNCSPYYQKINKEFGDPSDDYVSRPTLPVNNSMCTLFKLNHQGDLIWTKQFKGSVFTGKSLATSPDGNWFLLTYQSSGFYQTIDFDDLGNFQDSIHIPLTQNAVTLYKINSEGAVLWEKKMTGISATYSAQDPANQNMLNAELSVTSNHVNIQTDKDYIVLDQNGNTVQRKHPGVYFCSAYSYSITSQSDLFYSIGNEFDPADGYKKTYWQVSGSNGDVISHTFPEQLSSFSKIAATQGGLILNEDSRVAKYSVSGTQLWSIRAGWSTPYTAVYCATPSCSGGVIAFVKNQNGQTELIKTDANGKY